MIYRIVCVGKVKEDFYRKRIEELAKEIRKKHVFQIIEVEDEKTPENLSAMERERILKIEGGKLLHALPHHPEELIVALCIEGKQYSTEEWNRQLGTWSEQKEYKQVTYIIGGSLGLDAEVVKRADVKLSFSKLTFPHQLMRVIVTEQISRIC